MGIVRLVFGESKQNVFLMDRGRFDGYVTFAMPEFYGKAGTQRFVIEQSLAWAGLVPNRQASFQLQGDPQEIGIEYHGQLTVVSDDEIRWDAKVRNTLPVQMDTAFHTILLDTSGSSAFVDDHGERTFLYTDGGWARISDLLPDEARPNTGISFRLGAAYRSKTVMWKVIARLSRNGEVLIALASDRACAFSMDHPHWSTGLLASCRWGALPADASKMTAGRIYVLREGLDALYGRYMRDFKRRP